MNPINGFDIISRGHQNIHAEDEEIVAGCTILIVVLPGLTLVKHLFQ